MILLCVEFVTSIILLDFTNSFSLNDYKMNDKIIYKYFKDKYDKPCV